MSSHKEGVHLPVDTQDSSEYAPYELFESIIVLMVGYPGFAAVQKSEQNNHFLYPDLCGGPKSVFDENTGLQHSIHSTGTLYSVMDLCIEV